MTKEQTLNGMLKLFKITESPAEKNIRQLSEETNLPVAKITVLKQNGILVCKPVQNGKRGRAFEWVWAKDYRPNIHMAEKLAEARPDYPSQKPQTSNPTPQVEEKKEKPTPSHVMRSKVKVYRRIEITKSLNGAEAYLTLVELDEGLFSTEETIDYVELNKDSLRCWGYAFLAAADEISKE